MIPRLLEKIQQEIFNEDDHEDKYIYDDADDEDDDMSREICKLLVMACCCWQLWFVDGKREEPANLF